MTRSPLAGPARLPPRLASRVRAALSEWDAGGRTDRLWSRDPSLWTSSGEERWLGWLGVVEAQRRQEALFRRVSREVRSGGFGAVVVLGMGGSSLCPDVLARSFGRLPGFPPLLILDSTVPAQVRALERRLDLGRTLFLVSSKSGTTIEPTVFAEYFLDRVRGLLGAEAGSRFAAVTDPGSSLEEMARREGFREVYHGVPEIGGRFSALSHFGMVPAATMGVDVPAFLERAARMAEACRPGLPADRNPGVSLGVLLARAALAGRDKITVLASPGVASLGDWLEQLLAESLGKRGKGVVPVAGEPAGPARVYGRDRLFAQVSLAGAARAEGGAVAALARAGHPVVRTDLDGPMDLGREFLRWEVATAVAGSLLGVNPFDQPDVEAAKVEARKVTGVFEQIGSLPPETPALASGGLALFADAANAEVLAAAAGEPSPGAWLAAHLGRLGPGDYLAMNAFVEMSPSHDAELQALRRLVRDRWKVATTLGYGPRFLHSTGQLHKGGPPSGVFLEVTADDAEPVPIPGRRWDFGVLARAQARGDFDVLAARGRRLLRVHLGPDVRAGLAELRRTVELAVPRRRGERR